MSTIPACTSWLGHKFQGRYDYRPYPGAVRAPGHYSAGEAALVIRTMATSTYVRDVCVRCGHVIERSAP